VRSPGANRPLAVPSFKQAESSSTLAQESSPAADGRSKLSNKERAVLQALLKATPGALSAERLLEQSWDENVDPFTHTVRVTISRLRRRLGQPGIIHNTPGVGYWITESP
jgi:DNA-binding response OmpR family regulator